ncbi:MULTISPECIES: SDR family NAD(P)-dependent oxidoreductase [Streptomyces]|uniref:SDR family NAD(P)-dependent oxidoreductase n=1 Tax=Streptomyces TaxID=1883 RepID=UPI001F11418C|nr:SDR family NAD(P)-dependent oxidoreductase [Streptomyces sp. Z423-1]
MPRWCGAAYSIESATHLDTEYQLDLESLHRVTAKAAATEAVKRAHEHFGRLDVVVNNAGYGLFGAVEELTEQQVRDQMETNFYGALGVYNASKWALEAFSEALAQEVAGFGIKVTLVEPGGFATDWAGSSATFAEQLPAYDDVRAAAAANWRTIERGDPTATGAALLKIVDAENPPLRVFFGTSPLHLVPQVYTERLKTWEEWADVATQAQGDAA